MSKVVGAGNHRPLGCDVLRTNHLAKLHRGRDGFCGCLSETPCTSGVEADVFMGEGDHTLAGVHFNVIKTNVGVH
jgi:hypothetical protein